MNSLKKLIETIIKEEVEKLSATQRFKNKFAQKQPQQIGAFNLEEFKKIQTQNDNDLYKERLQYLESHAKKLGSGAARIVFDVGNGQVLKLEYPLSATGEQTKNEVRLFNSCKGNPILIPIVTWDEKFKWVIAQKADTLFKTEEELKAALSKAFNLDLSAITDMRSFLMGLIDSTIKNQPNEYAVKLNNNPLFENLMAVVRNCKLNSKDLHEDNWGTYKGNLVLIDYGF